jgi:hypothetical protein
LDVSSNLGGTECTPMQAKRRRPNLSTQKMELKLSAAWPDVYPSKEGFVGAVATHRQRGE